MVIAMTLQSMLENYGDLSLFVNADTFHFKRVYTYINQKLLRLYRVPLIIFHPLMRSLRGQWDEGFFLREDWARKGLPERFRRLASIKSENMKFASGFPKRLSTLEAQNNFISLPCSEPEFPQECRLSIFGWWERRCNARRPGRKRIIARRQTELNDT